MRAKAKAEGRKMLYDGRWRDRDPADAPPGVDPVIRLKAPRTGETVIEDRVQGDVRIDNGQLDDLIMLRSDGTTTYMLSVVADDHDMGVTHVIRGDDHLVNAARQTHIYLRHGLEAPGVRTSAFDPWSGWCEILQTAWCVRGGCVSRYGLLAGDHTQLPPALELEPWR